MDLTVKNAAHLLDAPEREVFQWISHRGLPAYRIKNQYRINRESLIEWATVNGIKISTRFFNTTVKSTSIALPTLFESIKRGGIHYGIKGASIRSVLTAAVNVLPLPPSIQRPFLLQMLLAREAMGSTGIGEGIALPHARNPIVLSVDDPIISIMFLEKPIDFKAIDNQPVFVFFMVISPTVRAHLHMLSRIAFVLQNPAVKKALGVRAGQEQLVNAVHAAEAGLILGRS